MGNHYMEISLDDRANEHLTQVARDHGISKAKAIQKGLGVLVIARENWDKGRRLAIVEGDNGELVGVIDGVYDQPAHVG